MLNKKIFRIGAFMLAILLSVGVLLFSNSLVGNPISALMARRTAENHVELHYGDKGCYVEGVRYDFKLGCYRAGVSTPGSIDGDFSLSISFLGKLLNDSYESKVQNGGNAQNRLYFEYREHFDKVIDSPVYPYSVSLGYAELEFGRTQDVDSEVYIEYPVFEPENDRFYDVGELGKTNGNIVLVIDDDMVTAEKAAEILLKTKELLDDAGVGFYSVSFVLQYPPYSEDNYSRPDGRIGRDGILYEQIKVETLVQLFSTFE